MNIIAAHANWPEPRGFLLERKCTEAFYVFVHFSTRVRLLDGSVAEAGACILSKPYSYRYFKAQDCALCHDWMHIEGSLSDLTEKYGVECGRLYYPENNYAITSLVSTIEMECQQKKDFFDHVCELKIEELLINMTRGGREKKKSVINSETYNLFIQARRSLQAQYNTINNLEDIFCNLGISPSMFYAEYKQIFGISPKQDLVNIRIEHAKNLLSLNRYSVREVSELVGYDNPCHFSRQFKTRVGITPMQYMHLCAKEQHCQ